MKKLFSVLVCILLFTASLPMYSQVQFGVKGGVNLTTTPAEAWKDLANANNYVGYFIGPMLDVQLPVGGLGFDVAVLYADKGQKIMDVKETGVEVPLNLKYNFGLGKTAAIYVAAGPSLFFNLANKDLEKKTFDEIKGEFAYKKAVVGLNFGFGITLMKHLQAGLNYNMQLTDAVRTQIDEGALNDAWKSLQDDGFKNKTWQVSIAYLF